MSDQRILLIEDNALNRKLMYDILQHQGFIISEAETAEEGIRLAQEQQPALILMDIRLPGMSGIEILQILRADPHTDAIPVIAVTASAMTEEQQQIRVAGFDGYQSKPIDMTDFLNTVQRVLERSHNENSGMANE